MKKLFTLKGNCILVFVILLTLLVYRIVEVNQLEKELILTSNELEIITEGKNQLFDESVELISDLTHENNNYEMILNQFVVLSAMYDDEIGTIIVTVDNKTNANLTTGLRFSLEEYSWYTSWKWEIIDDSLDKSFEAVAFNLTGLNTTDLEYPVKSVYKDGLKPFTDYRIAIWITSQDRTIPMTAEFRTSDI